MTVLSPLQDCAATIEALIFASDRPVRERDLIVHLPENIEIADVIALVSARYDSTSGIELCKSAMAGHFAPKPKLPNG
jgi:chromosome segregation and condensation protein ScpB